jgi:hypothetical protein
MRVIFHPEFSGDLRRFKAQYSEVSNALGLRFQNEVLQAIDAIKSSPESAGHFLIMGSSSVSGLRRKNLRAFPFFVLSAFPRTGSCSARLYPVAQIH